MLFEYRSLRFLVPAVLRGRLVLVVWVVLGSGRLLDILFWIRSDV